MSLYMRSRCTLETVWEAEETKWHNNIRADVLTLWESHVVVENAFEEKESRLEMILKRKNMKFIALVLTGARINTYSLRLLRTKNKIL